MPENVEWRPVTVDGRNWPYVVSDQGRVRRVGRKRPLTAAKKDGYRRVLLCSDGAQKWYYVHRLVAAAFLPVPDADATLVHHRNDNRSDNRVENLEWTTKAGNRSEGAANKARRGRARYTPPASNSVAGWKPIVVAGEQYPYEVSDQGQVRRKGKRGTLRPGGGEDGYRYVGLSKNGVVTTLKVHTLVAWAFLGAPKRPSFQVNHKNGVKHDNRAANLEWVSARENNRHARTSGLRGRLTGHVLTNDEARRLREDYQRGQYQYELAAKYGLTQSAVSKIVRGERYKDAGGPISTRNGHRGGNSVRGERHGTARISSVIAKTIRDRYDAESIRQADLAREYGLAQVTISNILRGRIWREAGGPIVNKPRRKRSTRRVSNGA